MGFELQTLRGSYDHYRCRTFSDVLTLCQWCIRKSPLFGASAYKSSQVKSDRSSLNLIFIKWTFPSCPWATQFILSTVAGAGATPRYQTHFSSISAGQRKGNELSTSLPWNNGPFRKHNAACFKSSPVGPRHNAMPWFLISASNPHHFNIFPHIYHPGGKFPVANPQFLRGRTTGELMQIWWVHVKLHTNRTEQDSLQLWATNTNFWVTMLPRT